MTYLPIIASAIFLITFCCSVRVRSYVGHGLYRFRQNNNNWFYATMIIFFGLVAYFFYYGFGEPILNSSVVEIIDTVKRDNAQSISSYEKKKNTVLYGQKISDDAIEVQKRYFETLVDKYPAMAKKDWLEKHPTDDNYTQFRENGLNLMRYGLFTSNVEIDKLRNDIPQDVKADLEYGILKEQIDDVEDKRKSWIPFLAVLFMIPVLIIVFVFSFSDEVVDFCESLIYRIKKMRKEIIKGERASKSGGKSSESPDDKKGESAFGKLNLFARMYSSDVAAEFSMKILEKIISLLRR